MGVEYAFELVLCHRGIGGGGPLVGLFWGEGFRYPKLARASILGIGFWRPLCYTYNKENIVGNY